MDEGDKFYHFKTFNHKVFHPFVHDKWVPKYPEFYLFEARRKTFADFPVHLKSKVRDFAEAGFFYTGSRDKVLCFFCGLGLHQWERYESPSVQHHMHAPHCLYLGMTDPEVMV